MVEGTGLENRHTGNGIVSSNLTLSVRCNALWDGWPSGLRRTPGKRVGVQASREFESRLIRSPRNDLTVVAGFGVSAV